MFCVLDPSDVIYPHITYLFTHVVFLAHAFWYEQGVHYVSTSRYKQMKNGNLWSATAQ